MFWVVNVNEGAQHMTVLGIMTVTGCWPEHWSRLINELRIVQFDFKNIGVLGDGIKRIKATRWVFIAIDRRFLA